MFDAQLCITKAVRRKIGGVLNRSGAGAPDPAQISQKSVR